MLGFDTRSPGQPKALPNVLRLACELPCSDPRGGNATTLQSRRRTVKSATSEDGTVKRRNAPKWCAPSRFFLRCRPGNYGRPAYARAEELLANGGDRRRAQVISRSTFDLQSVLKSLLAKAVRLCGAEMGLIYRQDGNIYRVAASFGHSDEFLEKMKQSPIHQDRSSATGRAVLERRVVNIPDTLADADYRWGVNIRSEKEMHRTILAVPMLKGDAIVGVIVIYGLKSNRLPTSRLSYCRTSRIRPLLQSRMPALSPNYTNCCSSRPRLPTCSRSSVGRLSTCRRYSTRWSNWRRGLCTADMGMIFQQDSDFYRLVANLGFSPEAEQYAAEHPISGLGPQHSYRASRFREQGYSRSGRAGRSAIRPSARVRVQDVPSGVPLLREGNDDRRLRTNPR